MPRTPSLQPTELPRERSRQPGLQGDPDQHRAPGMGDQPVSVRPCNYLEIAAITMHPQGDLLSSGTRTSTIPILQAQSDIPAPRNPRGADG